MPDLTNPASADPDAQDAPVKKKATKRIITPDNLQTLELDIFPDTGHHFKFIPFDKSPIIQNYDGKDRLLTRLCKGDKMGWTPYNDGEKDYPWIRWRFGRRQRELGLWIAVETNTGDVHRGCFLAKREVPESECPKSPVDWNKSPYAYARPGELRTNDEGCYELFIRIPNPLDKEHEMLTVAKLQIVWKIPQGVLDVDIVVDFGNTRTVVLAMEDANGASKATALSAIRPVLFQRRGEEYPTSTAYKRLTSKDVIADSWVLLQEPIFYSFDVPSQHGEPSLFTPSREYVRERLTEKKEGKLGETVDKLFQKTNELLGNKIQESRIVVTERIPQMFVEVAPVIMGTEAKETLASIDLDQGLNLTLSSPKRYLWDTGRISKGNDIQPWNMNPNRWSQKHRRNKAQTLSGQICRYMYSPDGCRDWPITRPPFMDEVDSNRPSWVPLEPRYARCNAMTWAALSIIENAYRQINSDEWKKGNSPFVQRRLRSISVTFPSGWISGELEAYRRAWERATDIFTIAHFNHIGDIADVADSAQGNRTQGRPAVNVNLDEAVASQLPFIYSEICRLGNDANLWISLYGGKKCAAKRAAGRPDTHTAGGEQSLEKECVRVMTVDIGGGTTDTSVVEYRNTNAAGTNLVYNVLFRDCSTIAGDQVMLTLIKSVLLPSMLAAHGALRPSKTGNGYEVMDEEVCLSFTDILSSNRTKQSDRAKWQRITRLVFVPIVIQWLTDVATCKRGYYESPEGDEFRSIADLISDSGVDAGALDEFNAYLAESDILGENFLLQDDRLEYDPDRIRRCIHDQLYDAIAPLAKFVAAYEVDVVTLSGKISEMPTVGNLLRDLMPIMPHRIVRMKDFCAGNWYPQFMSTHGRISDAKSVTAVGASIYAASLSGLLDWGLSSERDNMDEQTNRDRTKNYWGPMSADGSDGGFKGGLVYLEPDEASNAKKSFVADNGRKFAGSPISIGTYIGRQKFKSSSFRPEQQYKLVWNSKAPKPQGPLAIVLERIDGNDDDIRMVSIEATSPKDAASIADVALEPCTMDESGFWMESCIFIPDYSDMPDYAEV